MKPFIPATLLFIVSFTSVFGQNNLIEFRHYSRKDGLNASSINSIAQDADGFLWVAHSRGIQRFNGHRFEDFTSLIIDTAQAPIFSFIAYQPDSSLLIGTNLLGLYQYYPHQHTVRHFQHNAQDASSPDANFISYIYVDTKERTWVGTWFGLSLMHKDGTFQSFPFGTEGSESIYNYNVIQSIEEDAAGNFWIGTWGGGLHFFNTETHEFRHYEKLSDQHKSNLWIKDIAISPDQQIYLGTIGNSLLIFDPNTERFTKVNFDIPISSIEIERILSLEFVDDNLWVGTEDGLVIHNPSNGNATFINDQGSKLSSLQNKLAASIFSDNHGGIWIGAGGLSYFNKDASKFDLFRHTNQPFSLSDNEVKCFLEIDSATFWVSTEKGINTWNTHTNTFSLIKPFDDSPHILKKYNDVVFAALPRQGLCTYHLKTGEIKEYHKTTDPSNGLLDEHINTMDIDHLGNLWIGGLTGLSVLRASDGQFIHIVENPAYSKGLKTISTSKITIDGKKQLWLQNQFHLLKLDTFDKKLLAGSKIRGIVSDTLSYAFEVMSAKQMVISALYSDRDNVYVYDENKGLFIYRLATQVMKLAVSADKMAHRDINSIASDFNDGLWLGTDNGLARIDLNTHEVTDFYEADGLQGNYFQGFVALTTSSGQVLMGGSNGFNTINPQNIKLNPYNPAAQITDIQVYNHSLPVSYAWQKKPDNHKEKALLGKSSSYLEKLELRHSQNALVFELSSLNFLHPEKNQLSYYMEGFEEDWNTISNRRYISYNNLPEGKWLTLHVTSINNNGIRSAETKKLLIYIHPPFYNTTWFRALILVLVLTVAISLYRLRVKSLKKAKKVLEKVVEARTQEVKQQKEEIEAKNESLMAQSEQLKELDRTKTRFYTNISHEFRTPLSLIVGPVDEILKTPSLSVRDKNYLEIIGQNAQRMLRLIDQILDLSRLEGGALRLEVVEGNILNTINNIVDSFRFIASKHQIALDFMTEHTAIEGFYDQDKIEKITYNLLNNAFKYTDQGGEVSLKLAIKHSSQKGKWLSVTVADTGIGIHESHLHDIFNTYYRVDDDIPRKRNGAGIGLALVKKLVELHHGKIKVSSEVGMGTTFIVEIPLEGSAYSSEEKFEQIANHIPDSNNYEPTAELVDGRTFALRKVGKSKILLVEDHRDLLHFIANVLHEHFDVMTASDGLAAKEKLEKVRPDLVVSDVMMPRMDGFALCRFIKGNERYKDIPVILLTAKNAADSQLEGLTYGADLYLPKPVNGDLLKLRVENLLKGYANIRQKYESKLVSNPNQLEVTDEHEAFLKKVIHLMEKNIAEKELNIDLFAKELGMSRTLLYEKMKKATGQSMGSFIKTNRLNYAMRLLLENHFNTSELAYEVGFSDPKYFSKCFKKQFGKTPKDFLLEKKSNV